MGLKRPFARLERSPPIIGLMRLDEHVAYYPSGCASKGIIFAKVGPKEKKSKRILAEDLGPMIICEAFSKSPLSLHLKLKEMARRKGSPVSTNLSTVVTTPCNVEEGKTSDNNLMAEEAGLPMPPNLP